jgi:hypothetical protein
LWRTSDPRLDVAERERLVKELMRLRNRIKQAIRAEDPAEERKARRALHRVKVALGERGPPWWTDGAPDFNRHMVRNTPYREWYDSMVHGND